MRGWRGTAALICLAAGACFPRETVSIGASDPMNSIPAIQAAARDKNYKAIPALVRQLDNDDPAIRFYVIGALHELTGQTFEYRYYDEAQQRKPAVDRWRQWVKERRQ